MAPGAVLESSEVNERPDVPSFVLLDVRSYITGRRNSTTATSTTSNGLPIEVTFCAADPPALSHLSIHCPGLEVDPTDLCLVPRIISADADLLLLRVHRDRMGRRYRSHSDYFVYKLKPAPAQSELYLLPGPYPPCFNDNEIAILSYDDNRFAVATLSMPFYDFSFMLYVFRSGPDGMAGSWSSRKVPLEEPLRDIVCPKPDSAQSPLFHMTTKVITLGGAKGTVGFVDLWRGIILCDLLEEDSPVLRDMPLPLPAKGNWSNFLNDCPHYYRDIAVSQSKDVIKYVEMEINQPTEVIRTADSYHEWLRHQDFPDSCPKSLVPGCWRMTTWDITVPIMSWDNWRRRLTVCSEDINLPCENTSDYELLCELMSSGSDDEEEEENTEEAALSLGSLCMAYPTLSVADDDDVVYLVSKGINTRSVVMEVAVDASSGTLQGVAKLDEERYVAFLRHCLSSEISRYLETTDFAVGF